MKSKLSESTVLNLAKKLGYTLDRVGRNSIYLVKGDKRIHQRSYNSAYHYLYMKIYRENKKKELNKLTK